jgi:hypothetical protein
MGHTVYGQPHYACADRHISVDEAEVSSTPSPTTRSPDNVRITRGMRLRVLSPRTVTQR